MILRLSSGLPSVDALLAKVAEAEKRFGCTLQAFDTNAIFSPVHLSFAIELAKTAAGAGEMASGSIKNEVLLWLACTTNFQNALKEAGAKSPSDFVLALIEGKEPNEDGLLSMLDAKRMEFEKQDEQEFAAKYGIKKEALATYALEDLILEQMATSRIRG